MEVPQAGGPNYSCCAVMQDENSKRYLHNNFLADLETELLTHSVMSSHPLRFLGGKLVEVNS